MQRDGFTGRDYLTLMDYTPEDISVILETASDLKERLRKGEPHDVLSGKTAMMIFKKLSTRTRISFQAGCAHLGMQTFFAPSDVLQMKRGEPVKDTARVIDRYCDALFIRTYGQEEVEEFARYMDKPVINALTDLTHPCQGLADMLTIIEHKGGLRGRKLAYAGDVFNVCQTLMVIGSLMGMEVWVARPEGFDADPRILDFVEQQAFASGVHVTDSFDEALDGADVVYANTWHSMGVTDIEERVRAFAPYQVDAAAMSKAKPAAIFMHCLPGYRGEEMTDEVIEGPQSAVFDQAENRMHTQKALLYLLLES
jgi:ornithine carbamoyltransferase